MPRHLRAVRDIYHFGASVVGEVAALVEAAPGFVQEAARTHLHARKMAFWRLPSPNGSLCLDRLKARNPDWPLRPDYDPREWVLVFLHGYVDNTGADVAIRHLARLGHRVYAVRYPFLHDVPSLARELAGVLEALAAREPGRRFVPMGHSLGAFVWDHLLLTAPDVVKRYRMPLYIPIGSPRLGTLVAHLGIGRSARDMRPGSQVVREHLRRRYPPGLEVYNFISRFDLIVLPIETSLWPHGTNYLFSETGHIAQLVQPQVVLAIEEVLTTDPEVLRGRAPERPFSLTSFTWLCARLPQAVQDRLGMGRVVRFLTINEEGQRPLFRIRVVQREMRDGRFPRLLR